MQRNTLAAAWDFAAQVYARPGVREACLGLQDRLGLDVVALLVLLHRADRGLPTPGRERLEAALAAVEPWRRAAVEALRAVRRGLKGWALPGDPGSGPAGEQVRQQVAAAELAAERVELECLVRLLEGDCVPAATGIAPAATRAEAAVELYLDIQNCRPDARDRQDLAILIAAALPPLAGESAP